MVDSDDLVGLAEVAAMLRMSTANAYLTSTKRGFPDPVATLTGGRLWDKWDVQQWAEARERKTREVSGRLSKKGRVPLGEERQHVPDYFPPFDPQRRERAKQSMGIMEPERQTDQKEGTDEL